MSLTAVLTLRPSRQAADAVFATVGLAVMAEIWRSWNKELFGAYRPERHYSAVPARNGVKSTPKRIQSVVRRWEICAGLDGSARDCVIQEGGEHSNSTAH